MVGNVFSITLGHPKSHQNPYLNVWSHSGAILKRFSKIDFEAWKWALKLYQLWRAVKTMLFMRWVRGWEDRQFYVWKAPPVRISFSTNLQFQKKSTTKKFCPVTYLDMNSNREGSQNRRRQSRHSIMSSPFRIFYLELHFWKILLYFEAIFA